MRICAGSVFPGRNRCGGKAIISPITPPPRRARGAADCFIPASKPAANSCAGRRSRPSRRLAARSRRRADLSGPRRVSCRRPSASAAAQRASLTRYGSRWMPRWRGRRPDLDRTGAGPRGQTGLDYRGAADCGASRAGAQGSADQLSPAAALDDALQGVTESCAARICSGRPAFTGCCRRCSDCRSRSIITISSFSMPTAASCRNRRWRRACASCGRRADAGGHQAHGRAWPLKHGLVGRSSLSQIEC